MIFHKVQHSIQRFTSKNNIEPFQSIFSMLRKVLHFPAAILKILMKINFFQIHGFEAHIKISNHLKKLLFWKYHLRKFFFVQTIIIFIIQISENNWPSFFRIYLKLLPRRKIHKCCLSLYCKLWNKWLVIMNFKCTFVVGYSSTQLRLKRGKNKSIIKGE